jgi:serine/threonine-protein kinase
MGGERGKTGGGTDALLAAIASAPAEAPPASLVGAMLGRYRIEELLGRGGMGVVYRAHDTALGRAVAVKVIPPELAGDAERRARLAREAQAAAAIHHPNLVAVHDVGEHDGAPFIVMELVRGRPLRSFVGEREPDLRTRIRWLGDIARALEAAHRGGLVHRDIKPENVLVGDDGAIKVLDFGIARRATNEDGSAGDTVTRDGVILGTPAYMAPEQIEKEPMDARTDQFAWGVVAYELLTGSLPWWAPGEEPSGPIKRVLSHDPEPPSRRAKISPAIDRVILRALSKKKEDRFPSMLEAAAALEGPDGDVARSNRGALPWVGLPVIVLAGGIVLWRSGATSPAPAASPPPPVATSASSSPPITLEAARAPSASAGPIVSAAPSARATASPVMQPAARVAPAPSASPAAKPSAARSSRPTDPLEGQD